MAYQTKEREVTESRLFIVTPKEKTGKSTTELRVVSWNYAAPKIEKRSFWRKVETDSWNMGKNVGMIADDIANITQAWSKIEPLMDLKDQMDIQKAEAARKAKVTSKKGK